MKIPLFSQISLYLSLSRKMDSNRIKNTKWKTNNRIYSFQEYINETARWHRNGNDILVVERIAHLTVRFSEKRLLSIVTNNANGYANASMPLISSVQCYYPLNVRKNIPNESVEARERVCLCSIQWRSFPHRMFAAKWHLKPHRDAFKTIISHESLVIWIQRTI